MGKQKLCIVWIWYLLFDNARFQRWLARHRRNGWELEHVGCLFFRLVCSSDTRYRYYVQVMKDDPDTERGRAYLAGVEELGVTCLGCFRHRAFFRWEDDGRPVEMFSDLASQALEAKCVQLYTRTGNGAGSKTNGSFTNRPTGKEIPMDNVKKMWCGPVYTLDPGKHGAAVQPALRRGLAAGGHGLVFLPLPPRRTERVPVPCAVHLRVP